jgi:hypothetical protein
LTLCDPEAEDLSLSPQDMRGVDSIGHVVFTSWNGAVYRLCDGCGRSTKSQLVVNWPGLCGGRCGNGRGCELPKHPKMVLCARCAER